MEFKNPYVTSCMYWLLVLILLITPCLSKEELDLKPGEEVDQIDYKGPETHPFIPPPSNTFGPHSSTINLDKITKGLRSGSVAPLGRKGASHRDQGNVLIQKP